MLTSLEMIDSPRLAREERGEESEAGASLRLQLPAALPWHHHTVTSAVMEPPTPSPHPSPSSPVSSKLLQSAQALIGLGQREGGPCFCADAFRRSFRPNYK
ncbi:hypothetical protein D9C73_020775 [Xyrichtys novacula]|uniref:Uncharacterized protein n=1 Tax=Xyrichtys novacula TaxID=13765 RepID=A0AAV1GK25_XYRNO|nr:hypothetical protein D9C73_020775 [Xyrichtys novacula]